MAALSTPVRAFVALGANLNNPQETVAAAIVSLRSLPQSQLLAASSLYRSAPVGLKNQPDFINAVVALDTTLTARALLDELFAIEARFGRRRDYRHAPRTLDLDLLLYGDAVSTDPQLTIPHPRMHERAFVLMPLVEIAPDCVIPYYGRAEDLLAQCHDQRLAKLAH